MAILFLTQWHSPVRFVYFYPVLTDSWGLVFLVAGLLAAESVSARSTWARVSALSLVSLVGAVFRETALAVPLAHLYSATWPAPRALPGVHVHSRTPDSRGGADPRHAPTVQAEATRRPVRAPWGWSVRSALTPPATALICAVAGLLFVRSVASTTGDFSLIAEALRNAYRKPVLTYVAAWFIAFGPVIALPLFDWRRTLQFLRANPFLAAFLTIFALLAWVGGTDSERILYGAMPVVYVLIGRSLQHVAGLLTAPLVGVLALAQFVSQRMFSVVIEAPSPALAHPAVFSLDYVRTMVGRMSSYGNLWSYFAEPGVLYCYLAFYFALSAVVVLWLQRRASIGSGPRHSRHPVREPMYGPEGPPP